MTAGWSEQCPVTVAGATRHVLTADGEEWDVSVSVPVWGEGPYATLFLTDPVATFLTAAHVAQTMHLLTTGLVPPIAVVGVGPHTDDLVRVLTQRNRDLTPTDAVPPPMEGQVPFGTGGGERFLALLTDTVTPFLESNYPLDGMNRGIAGWSLGGLFACFALLTRPEFFSRCLAVSPSLWWDDRYLIERATGLEQGALADHSIYIGTGEHEASIERAWPPVPAEAAAKIKGINMVADAEEFAAALAKASGAAVRQETIADEHHNTIWAAGFSRGLVRLYADTPPA